MSFWKIATEDANIHVKEPTAKIKLPENSDASISGDITINKKHRQLP